MLQHKQIEEEYARLVEAKAIIENSLLPIKLKFEKAENDLALAQGLLSISREKSEYFTTKHSLIGLLLQVIIAFFIPHKLFSD